MGNKNALHVRILEFTPVFGFGVGIGH